MAGSFLDVHERLSYLLEEIVEVSNLSPSKAQEPKQYNFVKKLQERYTCTICHDLQQQPVLVSCCGQHFCKGCLETWIGRQGKSCPHCREREITYMVNKLHNRDINELKVYCSNKQHGCSWTGELGALQDHCDAKCQYTMLKCPQKCKKELFRKDLDNHIKTSCLCRDYSCEHCGLRGTYHTITGECGEHGPCHIHKHGHYIECQSYPVPCPNKCSQTVKRRDLASHRDICPLEQVECTFSEVGCTKKTARRDMEGHVTSSDHHHLLLTMKAFQKFREESKIECEQLRQEIKELKKSKTRRVRRKYEDFDSDDESLAPSTNYEPSKCCFDS